MLHKFSQKCVNKCYKCCYHAYVKLAIHMCSLLPSAFAKVKLVVWQKVAPVMNMTLIGLKDMLKCSGGSRGGSMDPPLGVCVLLFCFSFIFVLSLSQLQWNLNAYTVERWFDEDETYTFYWHVLFLLTITSHQFSLSQQLCKSFSFALTLPTMDLAFVQYVWWRRGATLPWRPNQPGVIYSSICTKSGCGQNRTFLFRPPLFRILDPPLKWYMCVSLPPSVVYPGCIWDKQVWELFTSPGSYIMLCTSCQYILYKQHSTLCQKEYVHDSSKATSILVQLSS